MIYRLTFEERKTTYKMTSDTTQQESSHDYLMAASAEADDKVMAGMLRALADKLDPPKTGTYRD